MMQYILADACLVCPPTVTTSVNGLNALSLLRSQPNHFDLVLSDVVMPGEILLCCCRPSRPAARSVAHHVLMSAEPLRS